ncbi:hypothetical protein BEUL_2299 [Bifidobacterium eulemuris]|uniref:Uncharacterized protein n=1 Tax=Bifidobacterium eulemuris TaxID=1765219 RepID=A0A261FXV1_9BIFI|nr:hypothetical protein BEUL_2299 [Bifidobacterium eulemuris]
MVTCLTAGVDRNTDWNLVSTRIVASPASRQVWIETVFCTTRSRICVRSPASRQVWIETARACSVRRPTASHLPHGRCGSKPTCARISAPATGVTCLTAGVDRNFTVLSAEPNTNGHLPHGRCGSKQRHRADRRHRHRHLPHGRCGSKRARPRRRGGGQGSPASRQVWIETPRGPASPTRRAVTCLTAGVDRNTKYCWPLPVTSGHLPHGRCGSKHIGAVRYRDRGVVTCLTAGVDRNPYQEKKEPTWRSPASRQVWIETRMCFVKFVSAGYSCCFPQVVQRVFRGMIVPWVRPPPWSGLLVIWS